MATPIGNSNFDFNAANASQSTQFKEPRETDWFYETQDVGMDEYVVQVGDQGRIGTKGLGPCIALCMKGKDAEETPVLGLFHASPATPIKSALDCLKVKMVEEGCEPNTIEASAVGGFEPNESGPGTIEAEEDVMKLSKEYNVKGTLFNLVKGEEESLSVVVTPKDIYVSKKELYQPDENEKGADSSDDLEDELRRALRENEGTTEDKSVCLCEDDE